MSMLSRFRAGQAGEKKKERRPFQASLVSTVRECEKWRTQVRVEAVAVGSVAGAEDRVCVSVCGERHIVFTDVLVFADHSSHL